MPPTVLVPHIEPVVALRHHCAIVAQAWGHTKSAVLPRNGESLKKLRKSMTYGRHIRFFETLPHRNPVDLILIGAAVTHVDQTLQGLRSWDEGRLIRTTWPAYRDSVIANRLGGQDVHTWARQNIYAGKAQPKPCGAVSLKATLEKVADNCLEQVLRHVIDVRDD